MCILRRTAATVRTLTQNRVQPLGDGSSLGGLLRILSETRGSDHLMVEDL